MIASFAGPSIVGVALLSVDPLAANVVASLLALLLGAAIVLRSSRHDRLSTACLWSVLGSPYALHGLVFTYPAVARVRSRRALVIALIGVVSVLAQLLGMKLVPVWVLAVAAADRAEQRNESDVAEHDRRREDGEQEIRKDGAGVPADERQG